MYVVCLDCGSRFLYDWEQMRIGATLPVDSPLELPGAAPAYKRSKLRFAAAICTLPLVWLIGKLAFGRKRPVQGKEQDSEPKHGKHDD